MSAEVFGAPAIPRAASNCPLGGTVGKSGDLFNGETFTFNDCKAATFNGSVTINAGSHATVGLLSGLSANMTFTFKDQNGVLLQTTTVTNLSGSVSPTLGGACFLTKATLTLTGTLATTPATGPTLSVDFADTGVTFSNITFNPSCVPTVYDMTLDGDAALAGPPPTGAEDVTFKTLDIHVDASGSATVLTLTGGMDAPCFGGLVSLTTQTSVTVPSGGNCPTAGVLIASAAGGEASITFQGDMSVLIQASGAPTVTAPNCLDPQLLMCLA